VTQPFPALLKTASTRDRDGAIRRAVELSMTSRPCAGYHYKTFGNKARLKRAYENAQVTNSPMTATPIVLAKKDRYEKLFVVPVDLTHHRFHS
jgi:hypothetical protein